MSSGPLSNDSSTNSTPMPSIAGMPVFGSEGYRLGEAVDFVLDFDANRVASVLVADVDTDRFPNLESGRKGVRIPFDSIRSIEDAILIDAPLAQFTGSEGPSPTTLSPNSLIAE
ncbi:Sporulation protein YlmC, PRC-barrel domain family [Halopelagius inordinatus]|uniref:Sporulation protein YlmC, PRC-barrel domain family n=1 Tax=Halopelagius inordinatus TaxID=553467 RepID=A0A1I2U8T7_9EURY|nr:PRC-barrel domain-containing protein [Halopelagius inordinatus]SFG71011.1 Sporulation protein YlmC, PRC-barrel domain family [Halopelagius inordinatus]